MMAQLTCQKASASATNGKPVLQDLDFEVFAGDYLCIVGENGSGKSTLMKTILGLQMPISGRILTGDGLRKNEIGYLPQQTVVQKDFPASVREIILSGCQGHCGSRPFYSKEEKKLDGGRYGENADHAPCQTLLPDALRRPAAAGTPPPRPLAPAQYCSAAFRSWEIITTVMPSS